MIVADTHTVVWLTRQQELLSRPARSVLAEGRREGKLAIADISLREIAELATRGRISVGSPLATYLRFIESLFLVLPISGDIADQSVRFGSSFPKDPADRLIGATAVVHGATLVTKDRLIRASGEVRCVW
jgi:PIN domain nuclease of toxin-antitoxin system